MDAETETEEQNGEGEKRTKRPRAGGERRRDKICRLGGVLSTLVVGLKDVDRRAGVFDLVLVSDGLGVVDFHRSDRNAEPSLSVPDAGGDDQGHEGPSPGGGESGLPARTTRLGEEDDRL